MSKQDGYSPRSAVDLERKYNFGKSFAEVYGLISDAQRAAQEAQSAFDGLAQDEIFNLLTDFGKSQGIYRDDKGNVYINASYIKAGKLASEYIDTDDLKKTTGWITGYEFTVMEEGLNAKYDAYKKTVDELSGNVTETIEKYSEISQTVDSISLTVEEVQKAYDELSGSIAEELKKYSTIEQTAESITSTVAEIKTAYEKYADEAVDGLSGTITETLKSYSTIEQTAKSISSTVEEVKTAYEKYADEAVDGLSGSITEELKKYSTIEQTAESITSTVAEVKTAYEKYADEAVDGLSGTIAETLKSYSTITQTSEAITSTVSEVKTAYEAYADGKVSDLSGSIAETLKSYSTIEQTASSISSTVSEVKAAYEAYADGKVSDLSGTITEMLNSYSTIEQTSEAITSKVAEVTTAYQAYADGKVSDLSGAIDTKLASYSTIEQTSAAITSTVARVESVERVNTGLSNQLRSLGDSMDTQFDRIGGEVSEIRQQADEIALSVEDLSSGMSTTLRLDAKGVTITDADGNAVEISGSQIMAGTLTIEQLPEGVATTDDIPDVSGYVLASNMTSIVGGIVTTDYVNALGISVSGLGGNVALKTANGGAFGRLAIGDAQYGSVAVVLQSNYALQLLSGTGHNVYIGTGSTQYDTGMTFMYGNAATIQGSFYPGWSGKYSCGVSGAVWSDVYAANATIQTSDLTVKEDVVYGLDKYDALFDALQPISFRFVDGNSGRVHLGMGAQDVEQALTETGLTSTEFAGFIKSPKKDDEGEVVEGEYDYALRYGEFIPLLIEQVQKLKQRVRALEGSK